jgi:pyridoxal phosphate enzyme (YggS family)
MAIADAVTRIQERIAAACARSGRNPADVRLCAVSKFQSRAAVQEAYNAGLRLFGESRVREAAEKFAPPFPDAELHLIGNLQRNKAKTAAALFHCIQSLDREPIIAELSRLTASRAAPLPVLLEMRTAEDSKRGFSDADALSRAAENTLACAGLRLSGLMTMAPFTDDERLIRASFRKLVAARRVLETRFPGYWETLSMGMSGDFEIAIEEGSTMVRIGTAIFGERNG